LNFNSRKWWVSLSLYPPYEFTFKKSKIQKYFHVTAKYLRVLNGLSNLQFSTTALGIYRIGEWNIIGSSGNQLKNGAINLSRDTFVLLDVQVM